MSAPAKHFSRRAPTTALLLARLRRVHGHVLDHDGLSEAARSRILWEIGKGFAYLSSGGLRGAEVAPLLLAPDPAATAPVNTWSSELVLELRDLEETWLRYIRRPTVAA